jgi:predicted regulator of Ras-like GTPase activity (Roadblock/LC7/MglB family)
VSLVQRLKRWSELARLRKRVRRDPTPASYAELAERLIALDESEEAVRVASVGLELFPAADRLAHVALYVRKTRMSGEIRRLRDDVQRRPTPLAFSQLARIYRELGSHDEALAVAQQCTERFPLNEAAYLVQGEIRLERFRRDLIARDAVVAESSMRSVLRLNAHNAVAHLRLAELCHLVGLRNACARHLRQVLAVTPSAGGVKAFLDGPGKADEKSADASSFEDAASAVQVNGDFAGAPEDFPASRDGEDAAPAADVSVDAEALRDEMAALAGRDGLRNAVLLQRDGSIVAECARTGALGGAQFAQLVAAIRDAADDASRRMDTGALVRADVEGPGGSVVLTRVRGLTMGLLYSEPLRPEAAWEIVQDFTARQLAAGREESRA